MSCGGLSALQSLCTKIADTCSCVFRCNCNNCCPRQNIILGSFDGKQNDLHEYVSAARTVYEAMGVLSQREEVHEIKERVYQTRKTSRNLSDQKLNQCALGVLQLIQRFVSRYRSVGADDREMSTRIDVAAKMAGVNLNEHYQNRTPLRKEKADEIETEAKVIQKFGSLAVYLWSLVQAQKVDTLKDLDFYHKWQMISDNQMRRFAEIISSNPHFFERIKSAASFAEMSFEDKVFFIRTAQLFPKRVITDKNGFFSSWHSGREIDDRGSLYKKETESQGVINELGGVIKDTPGEEMQLRTILGAKRLELMHELNFDVYRFIPLDSSICFLYTCLKKTADPEVLKKRFHLTDDIIASIRRENASSLIGAISRTKELLELEKDQIRALYRIAIKNRELSSLAGDRYSIDTWIISSLRRIGRTVDSPERRSYDHSQRDLAEVASEDVDDMTDILQSVLRANQKTPSPKNRSGRADALFRGPSHTNTNTPRTYRSYSYDDYDGGGSSAWSGSEAR
jgi:hypothetical protein